ncbi:Alpha/Beta hydrolase protein [Immersiella caudata]|uniref:Alpha/Beta hydrolase protein n=1 Tax=Immersiella caudata TaxID=314043 RepID=A0AA40CE73_9PEZI|nr:Alpha/Beta hydrolase protein [Immersiella caudata]
MSKVQSPSSAAELSLLDWASFAVAIPIFLLRWLASFTFQNHGVLHWRQKLALTFLRTQRASFSTPTLRWSVRRIPTHAAIAQYCQKHNIPHQSITLPPETTTYHPDHSVPQPTLHTITPSNSNVNGPTLFYIHGGGYVNPLRANAHMPFILACAASTNPSCSQAIILEYSLAPEHPYPSQLVQSLAALRYLLDDLSILPDTIILAGDSAGGQLIGAIFAHIVKPCPYFPRLTLNKERGERFRAAVLVSPFTRLPKDWRTGSYKSNEKRDYLTWAQVERFKEDWGADDTEVWANLCGLEEENGIWEGVFEGEGRLVENVLVTVGTAEVFLDDIREFATECVGAEVVKVRRGEGVEGVKWKRLVLVECEDEAHVQVALDMVMGYKGGSMMRTVTGWLTSLSVGAAETPSGRRAVVG